MYHLNSEQNEEEEARQHALDNTSFWHPFPDTENEKEFSKIYQSWLDSTFPKGTDKKNIHSAE